MDYQTLYNQYSEELNTLKSQKAVIDSKIKELAEQLNLDINSPLDSQVAKLKLDLEDKKSSMESELEKLVEELEAIQTDELS